MTRQRREFKPEFKVQVAQMITVQGLTVAQVCRDMDLSQSAVRQWVKQLNAETQGQAGIGKPITPEQLRIRELERENVQLKEDNALLKQSVRLLREGTEMSYRCVDQFQKEAGGIAPMCELLEVSRSGYYASQKRREQPQKVCPVAVQVQAAFAASGRSNGSRRIRAALANQGVAIGRYRVRTLMRKQGLRPIWRRKYLHTTDSRSIRQTAGMTCRLRPMF